MRHLDTLLIINRAFKHFDISKTQTNFIHCVTCSTRGDKTLDLLYGNVKDHCLIQLTPIYKPVRRQPSSTRTVQQWSVKEEELLMECYRMKD